MTKTQKYSFSRFCDCFPYLWSGFFLGVAITIFVIIGNYKNLLDDRRINSSKQLTIIKIPEGYHLESIDLLNDSVSTKPNSQFSQLSHLDTITIYDNEIETFEDAPPNVKKIPIYKIIQHQ